MQTCFTLRGESTARECARASSVVGGWGAEWKVANFQKNTKSSFIEASQLRDRQFRSSQPEQNHSGQKCSTISHIYGLTTGRDCSIPHYTTSITADQTERPFTDDGNTSITPSFTFLYSELRTRIQDTCRGHHHLYSMVCTDCRQQGVQEASPQKSVEAMLCMRQMLASYQNFHSTLNSAAVLDIYKLFIGTSVHIPSV